MDENTFWLKLWSVVIAGVCFIAACITAYNVVDRVGPVRPIVTKTTSYQAK